MFKQQVFPTAFVCLLTYLVSFSLVGWPWVNTIIGFNTVFYVFFSNPTALEIAKHRNVPFSDCSTVAPPPTFHITKALVLKPAPGRIS